MSIHSKYLYNNLLYQILNPNKYNINTSVYKTEIKN